MIVLTYSLNESYSGDLVLERNNNPKYNIHVDVVNGYETSYDINIDNPSFKQVIDSDYTEADLECNNSNVKYDTKYSQDEYVAQAKNETKKVENKVEKKVEKKVKRNQLVI